MRAGVVAAPPGQVVVVAVAVEQIALLDGQPAGVDRRHAGVIAQRWPAGQALGLLAALADQGALGRLRHVVVVDPAPAVRLQVEAGPDHRRQRLWHQFAGQPDQVDGGGQAACGEGAEQSPVADPAAVFVGRFHVQVARPTPPRDHQVGDPHFGALIPVENAHLGALLVVDAEIHRDAGAAGPLRVGRIGAVAGKIAAWQGKVGGHGLSPARLIPGDISLCRGVSIGDAHNDGQSRPPPPRR